MYVCMSMGINMESSATAQHRGSIHVSQYHGITESQYHSVVLDPPGPVSTRAVSFSQSRLDVYSSQKRKEREKLKSKKEKRKKDTKKKKREQKRTKKAALAGPH